MAAIATAINAVAFICFERSNRNVHGTGATAASAREQGQEGVRSACAELNEPALLPEALADLDVLPATAALVEGWDQPWFGRWEVVDGVACTYAEAHGDEHPDDKALREHIESIVLDALVADAMHDEGVRLHRLRGL